MIAKCLFSLFFISFICLITPLLLKFGFHSFSLLFLLHIQFYKREAVNITYAYNELRNAASGVCLYARTSYKCSKCVCFSWWAWGYAYGFHILIVIWTSFAHPILLITEKKGRGGGYITPTSLEVSRNDTSLKLLKNSTQALEACDEVNREVLFAWRHYLLKQNSSKNDSYSN